MKIYRVKIEVSQKGKILETKTLEYESSSKPEVGDCNAKLVNPPIYETIIDVEEIPFITKKQQK